MGLVLSRTHSVEVVTAARATGTALVPPLWGTKLWVCEKTRLTGVGVGTQIASEETVREEKGPGLWVVRWSPVPTGRRLEREAD